MNACPALDRARRFGLRLARLSDDVWLAESAAPELRGPYLVITEPDSLGQCECVAGGYRETLCHHRAAAIAAANGAYSLSEPTAIRGPGDCAAPRRETRSERHAREIAEYDALSVARRRSPAATITDDDYQMFG